MIKENVLFNISFAVKEMNIAFKQISKSFSVKVPAEELGILLAISLQNSVIQQDIAEYLKKNKSTVLRQIDKLEQKGLLTRTVAENDRRSNIVAITEKGKTLIEEVNQKSNEFFNTLSEDLNDNDLDAFFKVLSHLRTKSNKISK
ncbi:MAG: MarR family transcriptional regulator [Bacteroidales bacterium]|jgi:DNA-binding MarR family transcriptional regulator|nr:MarR family transcriptional regulator [Bacteroidales bacterium]